MPDPVRTAQGDLVERVALFAAEDPAQPLQGGDVPGKPIRTADGALVQRVAPYEVEGGVAVPVTKLGSDVGTDLAADPPLNVQNEGGGTATISVQPGANGQALVTQGGSPVWGNQTAQAVGAIPEADLGQPGGPAGPLDGSGRIPATQLPPTPLHETFEAANEAAMLAAPVSAPAVAIRTDFTPAHLFYLHTDPASTLGNWEDLGAGVSAGADPGASVGTVPVNGIAATYMRSDAAPRINQAMSPAWTGNHDFTGGTIAVPTPTTAAQAAPKGYVDAADATAGGTAQWGNVGGTLANQTDLSNALNAKASESDLATHEAATGVGAHLPTGGSSGQVLTRGAGSAAAWANPPAAPVQSVAGKTGAVTLVKGDVGLGNVDNTSDLNKPISTATQTALNGKANQSALAAHEADTGAGAHLPAGGNTGQIPVRGSGDTVAWADPPSAPVQSVNTKTGAVTLDAADVAAVPAAEKAVANGVATLGPDGKVPAAQLNIAGGFNYLGGWNAATNTPTLADGTGNAGDMYKVSTAGSQNLGGGAQAYAVGDHLVYVAGSLNRWELFLASEDVASVAGKTGVVILVKADVGLGNVDNTSDANKPISAATQTALDAKASQAALTAHTGNTSNPHGVTKAQVGLGNVDNTSDANKPVSTATAAALAAKADQTALTAHEGTTGAGTHLPAGGTSGQVPVKGAGNTVAWQDPAAGGGAPAGASGLLQYNNNGVFGGVPSVEVLDVALLGATGLILNGAGGYPGLLMSTDDGQTGWLIDTPFEDFAVERVSGGNPTGNFAVQATAAGDHAGAVALNADTVTVNGADIRSASALFTTGTVPPARLGTGTPTAGTVLRGDGTWAAPPPASAAWGSVTGDIANQGDLQQELNGRVLLTSKATETEARAGTDDSTWMTPLGTAQAIAEHQQTVPQTMSAHATMEAATNDPTTGVQVLFGPTPSGGAWEAWQIDWVVYVSADPSGRVEFLIPSQTGITAVTSGIGPAVGGTGGAAAAVDSTALIFQADAQTRLVRLTTFINSSPTTHGPIQLMMRSPDSVSVSAAVGSHVVAHKLMIAI